MTKRQSVLFVFCWDAVLGQREMPEKRRKEVLEVLAAHFQCEIDEITTEMMEELANMDTRFVN